MVGERRSSLIYCSFSSSILLGFVGKSLQWTVCRIIGVSFFSWMLLLLMFPLSCRRPFIIFCSNEIIYNLNGRFDEFITFGYFSLS